MKQHIRTLTMAGLDASGGAGLTADLNTFEEFGTFGQVILTTIVTMEPQTWAHRVHDIDTSILNEQIETILAGSPPISAMKTGMLGTTEIVELACETINRAKFPHVVIDPVLICKGEADVLNPATADALRDKLLPLAEVATPNLIEASVMAQTQLPANLNELKETAHRIHDLGARYVVIKGGKRFTHDGALDLYFDGKNFEALVLPALDTKVAHGAGCTFAAAITACLARGYEPFTAIQTAKNYVHAAIREALPYNNFVEPVFRPAYRLSKQGDLD